MDDVAFILPCSFSPKYADRLRVFRTYGLLNHKNSKFHVYFLPGPEAVPAEFAPDTWPYPVTFIPGALTAPGPRIYEFVRSATPELIDSARWWFKLDDDSLTDVDETVRRLDLDYDWQKDWFIWVSFGGGDNPLFIEMIKRSVHRARFLHPNADDKPVYLHEHEGAVMSRSCFFAVNQDEECQRGLKFLTLPANDTWHNVSDQGLSVLTRFVRIHGVESFFMTQWPNVYNFSAFGGRMTHIHFIDQTKPEWPEFLRLMAAHSVEINRSPTDQQ